MVGKTRGQQKVAPRDTKIKSAEGYGICNNSETILQSGNHPKNFTQRFEILKIKKTANQT